MDTQEETLTAKITVLLAAHNRRESTIRALNNLYRQHGIGRIFEPSVILVDDGSTDGTAEEVEQLFPQIIVVRADGNLYWCGGMCLAYANAKDDQAEFYLLLNENRGPFLGSTINPHSNTKYLNT